MLEKLHPRAISFEDQVLFIRQSLADIYDGMGLYKEAAQTLIAIPCLTAPNEYSADCLVEKYLKIVHYALLDSNVPLAEEYVNRASHLQNDLTKDELKLNFKQHYARILDNRRKFIDAAQRYNELSVKLITEPERIEALNNAILCAILAGAGKKRSLLLAILYKDERSRQLPCFPILEKMYLDRIIGSTDSAVCARLIQPHHNVESDKGGTILDWAIVEHNLLSASKVYKNISFEQLGELLKITAPQAEKVAAEMISEERMGGSIDQIARTITFEKKKSLVTFGQQIEDICLNINTVVDSIAKHYPDWYGAQIKAQKNLALIREGPELMNIN